MKKSKEYSQKIQRLSRSLKKDFAKPEKPSYDNIVEALVYAVIAEKMTETAAQRTMKGVRNNFVDINELRVSMTEEVTETLGADTNENKNIALSLYKVLAAVFNKYNEVSLESLHKIGKRPAKQILQEMDGISNFAVDYCMLTALNGHAIPLTDNMISYLKKNGFVDPEANIQETEGFLLRQISAANAYDFYALLRKEAEAHKAVKKVKKKTTRKTKTAVSDKSKTKKKKKKSKK